MTYPFDSYMYTRHDMVNNLFGTGVLGIECNPGVVNELIASVDTYLSIR